MDSNIEDKRFCTEWQEAFPDLNVLLISSGIEFRFVKVVRDWTLSLRKQTNI